MPELIPNAISIDAVAAGDACVICWGTGKPFGSGSTPESISVNFSGIEKGPSWNPGDNEPIDGEFTLYQDGSVPCKYEAFTASFFISVEFTAVKTTVDAWDNVMQNHCDGETAEPCSVLLFNAGIWRYVNGSCLIIIPEIL